MKFEISAFLPAPRNFSIFGQAELETKIQILLRLFTALHYLDRKLLCQIFSSANFSFRRNQMKKFEILRFSPTPRNFTIFRKAELETMTQILLQLSPALHCMERKLLSRFSTQAICLSHKTI